jgi:cellobiose-specific phosphotransferase system component IIA
MCCRGAVRQLPQLKFQSAVQAGDARSAAAAALEALEPAVKAAMANIERASAGQGTLHAKSWC